VGYLRPDRFSRYFRQAADYGLEIRPKERYLRLFPLPREKTGAFVFHLEEAGTAAQLDDELDFLLRPGIFALKKAVRRWRREFRGPDPPPRLEWSRRGARLVVVDTRKIARAGEYCLEGSMKDILLSCDDAPRRGDLLRGYEDRGFERAGIEDNLRQLLEWKLVLPLDGRLISLVLEAPCRAYVPPRDLPIGWVEGEEGGKDGIMTKSELRVTKK